MLESARDGEFGIGQSVKRFEDPHRVRTALASNIFQVPEHQIRVIVDDVGTVINPVTLKGQIHGGVAQGVGQALMEEIVYEPESGQLLSASFMEYAMPRADDFCDIHIESSPVPTRLNPLGAKGAGEAGTVGALPAVMNAVMDALAPLGVEQLDMPASSERVWQAIHAAKK